MDENSRSAAGYYALAGQPAVVTGAGSGIGEATARLLAALGASVAVIDRDGAAAERVASSIVTDGGSAIGIACDIALPDQIADAAARVEAELGPCRVLVNNAAASFRSELLDIPLDAWNAVLGVSLTGTLRCSQLFGNQMRAAGAGGSMIHVASICGHNPVGDGGAYSVAKAGLLMLSRALAAELAPLRIRSNTVSPGWIRTPGTERAYTDPEIMAGRRRLIPSGEIGRPEDVAEVIAFLASDRSAYVTAQDIGVDGGAASGLLRHVPGPGRPTDQ